MAVPSGAEEDRRGKPSREDTGSAAGVDSLARRLSALAQSLEAAADMTSTLRRIVAAAVDTVPGAEHAAVTKVLRRREITTLVATGELPRAVDHAQYDCGQGPVLESLYDQVTVRLSNLTTEQRWPGFIGRAQELGVGSMLCVQLFVEDADLGVLTLLSRQPNAFDDTSEHIALLFASHAAVAMSSRQHGDDMRRAVSTREVIGQAQGILMERFKITEQAAFQLLIRASQDTNRKLRDLAEELTATGNLPEAQAG